MPTKEMWVEANDTSKVSTYARVTQWLHGVQVALNKGENISPFLAVIATEKSAIIKTSDVLPFYAQKHHSMGQVCQPIHTKGIGR